MNIRREIQPGKGWRVRKETLPLRRWHLIRQSQQRDGWEGHSKGKGNAVQFSRSVMSDSLWSHGLQHTRLPCPSPTTGVCSNSCPLSRWCHPAILCITFSTYPQPFPASGSFPVSWLFTSSGWSIGVSASASVLPMSIQGLFPLGLTGLLSCCARDSQESSPAPSIHISKASVLWYSVFFIVQLSHSYMTTGKTIVLNRWTFVGKVMSLLFNMLSRFVIPFLPRSQHPLIS